MRIIKSSVQHPEVEYWYITNGGYHNNLDLYYGKFKDENLWFTYDPEDDKYRLWSDEDIMRQWIDLIYGLSEYDEQGFDDEYDRLYTTLYANSDRMDDAHIDAVAHEIYEFDEETGEIWEFADTRGHQIDYD